MNLVEKTDDNQIRVMNVSINWGKGIGFYRVYYKGVYTGVRESLLEEVILVLGPEGWVGVC